MASQFLDSAAGGLNNGTSWDNAYTSIGSVTFAAGDFIYIDDGHSESLAGVTINNGTLAGPVTLISVDKTTCTSTATTVGSEDADYSEAAAAQVTCTGATDFTISGYIKAYGCWFVTPDLFLLQTDTYYRHEGGEVEVQGNGNYIGGVADDIVLELVNMRLKFTHVGGYINGQGSGRIILRGVTHGTGTTAVNDLIKSFNSKPITVDVDDCDLSSLMAASGQLFGDIPTSFGDGMGHQFRVSNTKLSSSGVLTNSSFADPVTYIEAYNVTTGTNISGIIVENAYGKAVEDEAIYLNADYTTTAGDDYSAKIVCSTNADFPCASKFTIGPFYVDASATIRIDFLHDSLGSGTGSAMNNDEVWADLWYTASGTPVQSVSSKRKGANPNEPAALVQTGAGSGWTESLTNDKQEYISWTPGNAAGPCFIDFYVALGAGATDADRTVYLDPQPTVT